MMAVRVSGGLFRGRALRVAPKAGVRPTSQIVRCALFSIIEPYLLEANVLDLFAGTGSLGIEALSRGASNAHFVEVDSKQCALLRKNLDSLPFHNRTKIFPISVEKAMYSLSALYDLVLLDPPYDYPDLDRLLYRLGSANFLNPNSLMVLEHSRRVVAPESVPNFDIMKQRIYGDTQLSIYEKVGVNC